MRNLSIVEDLGMLHYVFADKTGTLTCNKMQFHSMCIGATEFGQKLSDVPIRRPSFRVLDSEVNLQSTSEFDKANFEEHLFGKREALH